MACRVVDSHGKALFKSFFFDWMAAPNSGSDPLFKRIFRIDIEFNVSKARAERACLKRKCIFRDDDIFREDFGRKADLV